jgi:hypothetical protein
MQFELNDREQGVVVAALEQYRDIKHKAIMGTPEEVASFKTVNEYDLLSPQHALMHTLTLLSKLLKKPVEHFANPQPSQVTPTSKDAPGGA